MLIVTTSCARLLTAITASQRFADASSTSVTALIVGPSGVPFRKDSSPFKGQRPCQPHMEHYARKLACDLRLARPVPRTNATNRDRNSSSADEALYSRTPRCSMEVPLTPLEFMRRARSLYGSREAVV